MKGKKSWGVSISLHRQGIAAQSWIPPGPIFGAFWGATSALVCGRTIRSKYYKKPGVVFCKRSSPPLIYFRHFASHALPRTFVPVFTPARLAVSRSGRLFASSQLSLVRMPRPIAPLTAVSYGKFAISLQSVGRLNRREKAVIFYKVRAETTNPNVQTNNKTKSIPVYYVYDPGVVGRTLMKCWGKIFGPYRRTRMAEASLVSNPSRPSIRKVVSPRPSTSFLSHGR